MTKKRDEYWERIEAFMRTHAVIYGFCNMHQGKIAIIVY